MAISALILALSACGGGGGTSAAQDTGGGDDSDDDDTGGGDTGGGDPPTSPFTRPTEAQALYFVTQMPAEFQGVKDNYNNGGFTPFTDLPAATTVTYEGFMELAFFTTPNANITSQTSVSVNMQTGATNGTASEFMGWVINPATGLEELAVYEGDVVMSGGNIFAGSIGQTQYNMQVNGALDNGEQNFTVDGQLDGLIYGPAAEGVYVAGSDFGTNSNLDFTVDGQGVSGTAALWGLED
ncbi:hypothetical protein RCCS2_11027 [Roseobacter sp. CCS2]|nr:hypothetical protein RCCS2_11027 [Roseobacter sp. CCS2]